MGCKVDLYKSVCMYVCMHMCVDISVLITFKGFDVSWYVED